LPLNRRGSEEEKWAEGGGGRKAFPAKFLRVGKVNRMNTTGLPLFNQNIFPFFLWR
jgi:hypothetical protein